MIRLEMKNRNTILKEKQQKCRYYHQEKFINMIKKYLTDEELLPSNQRQLKEQAEFACSPLEKAFEK